MYPKLYQKYPKNPNGKGFCHERRTFGACVLMAGITTAVLQQPYIE